MAGGVRFSILLKSITVTISSLAGRSLEDAVRAVLFVYAEDARERAMEVEWLCARGREGLVDWNSCGGGVGLPKSKSVSVSIVRNECDEDEVFRNREEGIRGSTTGGQLELEGNG